MKYFKGILFLVILTLVTVIVVSQLYQKIIVNNKAATVPTIENLRVQILDTKNVLVSFYTPTSTLAYIEYKDMDLNQTYPIFQSNRTETDFMHSFIVKNVEEKGGEAVIIVDGKRFLFNNQPLRIQAK